MTDHNVDLNLLRTFFVVMELGSYKKAGEALCVSYNTVSNSIKRLRESVGKELFHRDRNNNVMVPTQRAVSLYAACKPAIEKVYNVINQEFLYNTVSCNISIAGVKQYFDDIHPQVEELLSLTAPKMKVESHLLPDQLNIYFRYDLKEVIKTAVNQNKIDIIVHNDIDLVDDVSALDVVKLVHQPHLLVFYRPSEFASQFMIDILQNVCRRNLKMRHIQTKNESTLDSILNPD